MAVLAIVVSFGITACSSDDDDEDNNTSSSNSLVGCTYMITAWDQWDEEDADEDDVNPIGVTLTFNANGTVSQSKVLYDYFEYKLTDDNLTFILGEDGPDDCMDGTITVNGSTVTFTYYWRDYDGKWSDLERDDDEDDEDYNPYHTMTLVKQ